MCSISSQVSADSRSDSNEQECEPSPFVSKTSFAEPFSPSTGRTSHVLPTSAPLTQVDWIGSDQSILSAAASPVSHSQLLEIRERTQTTATSGRQCAKSLHSQDPLGSLVKMLLGSSRWHSTMCSLTWRVSATPRGRLLFRLVPSMRDTDGTELGLLLPTPTAQSYGTNQGGAMGRIGKIRPSLETMARKGLWPTPVARDYKGQGMSVERRTTREPDNLCSAVIVTDGSGSLNPTWVEWLMGFPLEHTALKPSEMPSSRKSSKNSDAQS